MNNQINLNNDPMDSGYTQGYSIDLTRNNNKIMATSKAEVNGLSSLTNPTEEVQEKKISAAVVPNARMSDTVQEFDPTTIVPKKEKFDPGRNEIMSALDTAVEREKQNISKFHQELEEAMYEDFINNSDDEIDEIPDTNTAHKENYEVEAEEYYDDLLEYGGETAKAAFEEPEEQKTYRTAFPEEAPSKTIEDPKPVSIQKSISDEFSYDDDELDNDFEDSEASRIEEVKKAEDEMNDIVENLKNEARSTMRPKMNTIDLSKFKIGNRGIKSSTVIIREEKDVDTADWVMYESGYPISMSALTGPELIKLDPENSNRNRYNTLRDIYKIIYDHVVDEKKVSFDAWLKQTRYADIDHIYFALYMATFNGSNFISYQCPDCKRVFIHDVNFNDMIKYKDDSIKNKVKEMMDKSTNNGEIKYEVDLVQVNNKYVFGMKSPSLYNIAMETAGLPENLLEKYSDLIDTITYIDSIYIIDYTNMELTPIIIPTVKDDPVKSTAKKIKSMYSILKTLSSDEYYVLRGYISKLNNLSSEISYLVPGTKCPDCDKEIPANENTTAQDLLFTRHHLGAFANL